MTLYNCLNCGAPLSGAVCAYCGTDWSEKAKEPAKLEMLDNCRGIVRLFGVEFEVDLVSYHIEPPAVEITRDILGRVRQSTQEPPVEFVFVGHRKDGTARGADV